MREMIYTALTTPLLAALLPFGSDYTDNYDRYKGCTEYNAKKHNFLLSVKLLLLRPT